MMPGLLDNDRSDPSVYAHRRSWWRSGAIMLALVGACVAWLPATALAAKPLALTYTVTVKTLALARGNTVKVKGTVTSPEAKVKGWWSQKTVAAVVRKGVNGGRQTPYTSEGFRCKVVVRGELTSYSCTLIGADVPTIVRLNFAITFRGATRSG
jgi:hypothetical protein